MVSFQNPLYFQVLFSPVNAEQPEKGTADEQASSNKESRFFTSPRQPLFNREIALLLCSTDIPIPPICFLDVGAFVQTRPLDCPAIPWYKLPLLGIGFGSIPNLRNITTLTVLEVLATIRIRQDIFVLTGNHACLFQSFGKRIEYFRFLAVS